MTQQPLALEAKPRHCSQCTQCVPPDPNRTTGLCWKSGQRWKSNSAQDCAHFERRED